MAAQPFKPALIVVDVQEDFCPPSGSLAVPDGRAVVSAINTLLASPSWAVRVATKDWHPENHVSFAANHPGQQPFVDFITVTNPLNPAETYSTRLWPVHCVQNTPGAELIAELDVSKVDIFLEKGTRHEVEMYSAFYDPLKSPRVSDTKLAVMLKDRGVTHVYVVGLAADYCVKSTALDAAAEGFITYIVEEATRAVDPDGWPIVRAEIEAAGVRVVGMESDEVAKVGGQRGARGGLEHRWLSKLCGMLACGLTRS